MTFIYVLCFLMIAGSLLYLLDLKPLQMLDALSGMLKRGGKTNLKKRIKTAKKPRKINGIRRILMDCKIALRASHKIDRFSSLTILSLFLFVTGILIGGILDNPFLMPVLAGGLALLPFLAVLAMSAKFKKDLNAELETDLSTISSSYLRSEDIVAAVEENVDNFHSPVREAFQKFLAKVRYVTPDITAALADMKEDLNNDIFNTWVDAVIQSQTDRTLKTTVQSIVNDFSDSRIIEGDLENRMYAPLKDFCTVAVMMVGNIPFMSLLNKAWYGYLMHTVPGQFILAVSFLVLFICLIAEVRLAQPVEYKRDKLS